MFSGEWYSPTYNLHTLQIVPFSALRYLTEPEVNGSKIIYEKGVWLGKDD